MAVTSAKTSAILQVFSLLAFVVPGGCSDPGPDRSGASLEAAGESRSGHGTGIVTAVDAGAGSVTIEHGPMPEIGWSAMTMTFAADPALLAAVEPGDRVAFDLAVSGNRAKVTALGAE